MNPLFTFFNLASVNSGVSMRRKASSTLDSFRSSFDNYCKARNEAVVLLEKNFTKAPKYDFSTSPDGFFFLTGASDNRTQNGANK